VQLFPGLFEREIPFISGKTFLPSASGRPDSSLLATVATICAVLRISSKTIFINAAVIVAFGILIPWRKGYDFLDALLIVCYVLLSLLFVAPAIADFMTARPDSVNHLFTAISQAVAYSWGISIAIIALGIATVNLTMRHLRLLYPQPKLLGAALFLGLVACVFVAAASALLTLLFSASVAKGAMRIGFLLLLALILFGPRFLPLTWQAWIARQMTTAGIVRFSSVASGIVILADVILLAALRSARPREPDKIKSST